MIPLRCLLFWPIGSAGPNQRKSHIW